MAWRTLVLITALLTLPLAGQQPSPRELFERARLFEESSRSLDEAIALYGTVAAESNERELAATAYLRMGLLHERLGHTDEAQRAFSTVISQYADQPDVSRQARAKLAAGGPSFASPAAPARRVWAGPDVDFMGRVSPDGRYVSFVDWDTGDLAIRDLRTGQKRRLTAKGSWNDSAEVAQYSAFSPDGSQVAYAWRDSNSSTEDLRIVGRDGGRARVLYRNDDAEGIGPHDWSPDGKQLVTVIERRDRTNQLVIVSVADGATRVLKSFDWRAPAAAFSPDGRYIVYDFPSNPDVPERDLFLITADGSREVPLVTHPANDFGFGWSPDGRRVVFVSDRTGTNGVWTIRVSDGRPQGEPELLKPDIGRVDGWGGVTKTGDFYYGINIGVQDVYTTTIDPVTGNVSERPAPLRGRFVGGKVAAAWSTDGEHLAYISQSPQQLSAAGGTLSIHTLKTGQVRDVPLLLRYANNPIWLPDGRALIVWGPDLRGRRGLHRVDLSTGSMEQIVPGPGRDTPEPRAVLVALSPDGAQLFYSVGVGQGLPRNIRMRDVNTAEDRQIHADEVATFALSPDGRWLALRPMREARIDIVPATGGKPRTLVTQEESERGSSRPLAWSQDGKYVLFVRGPVESGLVPGPAPNALWRIPVEGGAPQKLDIELPAIRSVSVHPDGRRLAISAGSPEFEVWVLENFLPAPPSPATAQRR